MSPSFGLLAPLPPISSVLAGKPSVLAASRMPLVGSTVPEIASASGFKPMILVSCAEKSVSRLP